MLYITDFYLLYLLGAIASFLSFTRGQIMLGVTMAIYAIAGFIIYLRTGNIRKARKLFHKGKFNLAAIMLMLTFPHLLSDENKASYLFLKGMILLGIDNKSGFDLIQQALDSGNLPEPDRTLAQKILFGK